MINLIVATRTKGRLRVKALVDAWSYELRVKIPDAEMKRLDLRLHRTLPAWNYKRPRAKRKRALVVSPSSINALIRKGNHHVSRTERTIPGSSKPL